jgi:hypothetical protein
LRIASTDQAAIQLVRRSKDLMISVGYLYSGNKNIAATNIVTAAPTNVDPKTNIERSFRFNTATIPVISAEMPEQTPASIESANSGLCTISSNNVLPSGADLYKALGRDDPMTKKRNIARISPTDHLPGFVLGMRHPQKKAIRFFPLLEEI